MKCERNETLSLSELCLDKWQNLTINDDSNSTENCFPDDVDNLFTNILALWFLICSIVGVFGNLLTLIAMPYAAWKKRYYLKEIVISHVESINQSSSYIYY